uniref:(S)-2-hydroxy-acid oxidase n=1 Tax=Pavo cristatus TaxID=9049 RepID=A0A8C9L847_PAVCR
MVTSAPSHPDCTHGLLCSSFLRHFLSLLPSSKSHQAATILKGVLFLLPCRIRFRPRMLRDVSMLDTRTKILGTEISFPVGIAPTGFHQLAWPDGEKSTARAAKAMGTCYIASTYSTCSLEEIAAAAPGGFRWFQLYIHRNRAVSRQLVQQAEALGFQGLVLTADLPYTGKRRNDVRNGFRLPPHMKLKNLEGSLCCYSSDEVLFCFMVQGDDRSEYGLPPNSLDPSVTWDDIYWLRSLTHLPIVIKGILTKEDAELAVRHGVQGIIVSNHGGRQLDGAPATVSEKMDRSVCVFQGEEGLQDVLRILHDEFRLSMALAGKHLQKLEFLF